MGGTLLISTRNCVDHKHYGHTVQCFMSSDSTGVWECNVHPQTALSLGMSMTDILIYHTVHIKTPMGEHPYIRAEVGRGGGLTIRTFMR